MSHHGGGGYRRGRNYHRGDVHFFNGPVPTPMPSRSIIDDHEHRREVYESPEQQLRSSIIRLGEVDPREEVNRLAQELRKQNPANVPVISEGFRIGVTEQPFKIPYYASLLRLLHDPQETLSGDTGVASTSLPLGRLILEDFWKAFQAFLDKLAWRETRLCIHFFAHLTVAHIISTQSMYDLLRSFTAVLDEFGVSHGRAKKAALCAAEGLMMAGTVIKDNSNVNVRELIDSIQTYIESTSEPKNLIQPMVRLFSDSTTVDHADELLDLALAALRILDTSGFTQTPESIVQPYAEFPTPDNSPFELPSVLVPPEVIELDSMPTDSGEDAQVKKEEWPEFLIRLFDNDVTPDPSSPAGYAVRSAILDLVDIFEVNRKECARLLLEVPKWLPPGTFRPRPGAPPQDVVVGKDWQLESTIIENILGSLFLIPEPPHKPVYYIALITELCKLSPETIGPAVGKSIRKLYGLLADGLDLEIARRLTDWFSTHLSNFGFQWVWKEWVPDLSLSPRHPKREFIRRVVDYEIRLSYYDRILKTLPEPMQAADALVMPPEAPGPEYEYDDPASPYHDAAQTVLNLLRGRTKAEDVITHLDQMRNTIETTDSDANVDSVVRIIAVQSLLHIGSRSFSHFLNAIERYLPVLRNLAAGGISGGVNVEARGDILTAVARFWKRSRHMIVIVFDKLMQYQIVDPTDVVAWSFDHGGPRFISGIPACGVLQWEIVKAALDKANGRVLIARRRVTALRKEEDENAARAKANDGASMEVDADTKPETPVVESPALVTALKAFTTLTREQKAALSKALDGFVECLASKALSNPDAAYVISEAAWNDRANWNEEQWLAWETWGWYRHFCRMYSPYLQNYSTTLSTVSFAKVGASGDPASDLFRKTWNVITGQDV